RGRRCLVSDPQEQRFLEELTGLLKLGAIGAYPRIEAMLFDTSAPTQDMELDAYEQKMNDKTFPEATEEDKKRAEIFFTAINSVNDPNGPAPTPPPGLSPERMEYVVTWLQVLGVNGPELLNRGIRIGHIFSVWVYSTETYKLMNTAEGVDDPDKLRQSMWDVVERSTKGDRKAELELPKFVRHNSRISDKYQKVIRARSSGGDVRSALRALKAEFDQYRWADLLDEARMHNSVAARTLENIPDLPPEFPPLVLQSRVPGWRPDLPPGSPELKNVRTFRGSYRTALVPIGELLRPSFTTKKLTSTSLALYKAGEFAAFYQGLLRQPVVAEISGSGKAIFGISQFPTEVEVLIPKGFKLNRVGELSEKDVPTKAKTPTGGQPPQVRATYVHLSPG
ncbi:ADP-ribosyltransferase family protein, partial [Streptomyces lavendulae]